MSIGQPQAYEKLMGKLPYGHFDVVIPIETKDPDPSEEDLKKVRALIHGLPSKYGLRKAITRDVEKGPGCFILRVIGPQEGIDLLRRALSEATL